MKHSHPKSTPLTEVLDAMLDGVELDDTCPATGKPCATWYVSHTLADRVGEGCTHRGYRVRLEGVKRVENFVRLRVVEEE